MISNLPNSANLGRCAVEGTDGKSIYTYTVSLPGQFPLVIIGIADARDGTCKQIVIQPSRALELAEAIAGGAAPLLEAEGMLLRMALESDDSE